jgi:hypothetical protein
MTLKLIDSLFPICHIRLITVSFLFLDDQLGLVRIHLKKRFLLLVTNCFDY